eukprot:UN01843
MIIVKKISVIRCFENWLGVIEKTNCKYDPVIEMSNFNDLLFPRFKALLGLSIKDWEDMRKESNREQVDFEP